MKLKNHIAEQLVGKSYRFKCDCTARIDFVGTIVGYDILSNEIVFKVQRSTDGKLFDIGENHPSMEIYPL